MILLALNLGGENVIDMLLDGNCSSELPKKLLLNPVDQMVE